MTAHSPGVVGAGHGPDGSPLAIAISPVLTGRDAFASMRAKILQSSPGSRLPSPQAEVHAWVLCDELSTQVGSLVQVFEQPLPSP